MDELRKLILKKDDLQIELMHIEDKIKSLLTSHNTDYDFGSEKEPQPKGKDASHPSHNQ